MRFLLVEDEECVQEMITGILKCFDPKAEIEVTANGDDAIKRYLERSYHLVITDHAHPGVFGIELIELILAKNPFQPVILETGNTGGHIEAFKQKHQAVPFLEKPFRRQQLLDLVRNLLQ